MCLLTCGCIHRASALNRQKRRKGIFGSASESVSKEWGDVMTGQEVNLRLISFRYFV